MTIPLKGRVGAPFPMFLERGKSREFRRATTPALWTGPTSDDDLTPVTFLVSAKFWIDPVMSAWHGVDRDYRRILHGEQEFTFPDGPPAVGTEVVGTERIARTYDKTGSRGPMMMADTITDFARASGDGPPVASMRSTSITLHEASSAGLPARAPTRRGGSVRAGHRLISEFTDAPWSVTEFVRYQGASGDFNPIHHDAEFARAAGYPGPFAPGMLAAGMTAAVISSHADLRRLRSFTTRWKALAWPGDALTYRVFEAPEENGERFLFAEVCRPDGETHMRARARFAS